MAYAIDTRCIHGEGHKNQDGNYAISYPIYQTASFSHLTPGHNPTGFDYSRESNPTRAYLEETWHDFLYGNVSGNSGGDFEKYPFDYFRGKSWRNGKPADLSGGSDSSGCLVVTN